LNIHPSLLPRYRGSAPIQAAILNGDAETGVSIIKMVRRLDAGPIVAQESVALDGSETGGSLSDTLASLAGQMLPDVALDWSTGQIAARAQDDQRATMTRELTKADGEIDWNSDAHIIERQVRAFQPWPAAWTTLDDKRVVIERAMLDPHSLEQPAGSLVSEHRDVLVACGTGSLKLIEVRPEGKRAMPADAWFRGLHGARPARFEAPQASRD
jgi:methionyl-tRNA formyltransferase